MEIGKNPVVLQRQQIQAGTNRGKRAPLRRNIYPLTIPFLPNSWS